MVNKGYLLCCSNSLKWAIQNEMYNFAVIKTRALLEDLEKMVELDSEYKKTLPSVRSRCSISEEGG